MPFPIRLAVALTFAFVLSGAHAAELATLTPDNWDRLAPAGKEADAIYGDYVLRNDKIVCVIGNPLLVTGRSTDRNQGLSPGGNIIDLTSVDEPNDLLISYKNGVRFRKTQYVSLVAMAAGDYRPQYAAEFKPVHGKRVELKLPRIYPFHTQEYTVDVRYILEDGWDSVLVEVEYFHPSAGGTAPKLVEQYKREEAAKPKIDPVAGDLAKELDLHAEDEAPTEPDPALGAKVDYKLPVKVSTVGALRVDRANDMGIALDGKLLWTYDRWHGQAYGVLELNERFNTPSYHYWWGWGSSLKRSRQEGAPVALFEETFKTQRRVYPAKDQLELLSKAYRDTDTRTRPIEVGAHTADGSAVNATVEVHRLIDATGGPGNTPVYQQHGIGRTDAKGDIRFDLPAGSYRIDATALGRPTQSITHTVDAVADADVGKTLPTFSHGFVFKPLGNVRVTVADGNGKALPAKVEFRGKGDTPDPEFGPDTGDRLVGNLVYTEKGSFTQAVPPGDYEVVVTRGPEYEAKTVNVTVKADETAMLSITLERVVDTTGWIAADMHSHSTMSVYDNQASCMSSTVGRVLNHLAEGIEFAPATEHNRIATWQPHIESLGATDWLKSCTGIGYTDYGKYAYNEQNAFPFPYMYQPRTQGGGAPQRPHHCMQVNWLAAFGAPIDIEEPWQTAKFKEGKYDGPEKLIQILHRDNIIPENKGNNDIWYTWAGEGALIWPMFRDWDEDGLGDRVEMRFYRYMDTLEVRSLWSFIDSEKYPRQDNDILDWLLMLKHGYRIVGTIGSRAEHNFHGSGGLRCYIKSPTDNPAAIDPMDVVHAVKAGHVVMSTGPFVTATAQAARRDETVRASIGEEIAVDRGTVNLHVRVQAPDWITIDRVHVLRNGERSPKLTFTRKTHASMFGSGVVQFDQSIEIDVAADTHLVVIAVGSGPNLRERESERDNTQPHIAVANPIYLDVDGDGFRPGPPQFDKVKTELKMIRPVVTEPGAPPGKLQLTLENTSATEQTHELHFKIFPRDEIMLVGRNPRPVTIPAGETKTVDIELEPGLGFAEEAAAGLNKAEIRVYLARSIAGEGMHAASITIPMDNSPEASSSLDDFMMD